MCKELIPSLDLQAQHINELGQQMRILIAIQQRMLDVLNTAQGLPLGDPYIIDAANPATNIIQYGAIIPQASILRQLSLSTNSGSGLITIYVQSPYAITDPNVIGTPAGNRAIWRGAFGINLPVTFDWRVRLPAGSKLGIATNAPSETHITLCAIIDQAEPTATDQFYGRR